MCSTKLPRKVLVAAMLAAAALGVTPEAPGARERTDATAAGYEARTAVEAERRWQARAEQRRRLERQARAHARMPSTMYASTPDPAPPPHPAHSAASQAHHVAFFPSASRWAQGGYQGFARVINRTGQAGEVRIEAWDDAGVRHGPATLRIGANASVQFNSADLESGNAGVGLSGGIGAGTGDWRLRLSSSLDLQALAYIRTREGFLTSMHDLVPQSEGAHRVVLFNPGRNRALVSRLRLVNAETQAAAVRIEGIDARGASSHGAVELSLAAGASRMLSASQLESGEGEGLSGALGTGQGKWQLLVSADRPLEVMSLLSTRSGHLTNLSTAPAHTESAGGGATVTHSVAFFPSASRWAQGGYQGFARLINRTGEAGEVRIEAWDDAGVRHGPATLAIGAHQSVQFNSADLESGNAGVGLSGGIGAGTGDWRLGLSSSLDLQVLAYIRTREGFLTSMHDLVPESEGAYRVVIFNPGRNRALVSRLRVVNPGTQAAAVRIEGIDAKGASSEGTVEFTLAAGASRMLSASQLESGEGAGLSGALGTGQGKWQLVVSADRPLEVMSLLSTRSGHLTNLSSSGHRHVDGLADADRTIAKYLAGPANQGRSPGLFAAIIDGEGVRAIAAAGVRKQGSPQKLTVRDLVHIGSNTKAMTSTMLATLVAEGVFPNRWRTSIAEVFPELRGEIHSGYHSVNLYQLVRMRGGIAANATNWWAHDDLDIVTRRYTILRENLRKPPAGSAGGFLYSNLGYMIAGAMAERLTGKSWETLMKERLFMPLDMTTAGFGAPGTRGRIDQPWGHRRNSGGVWMSRQFDNASALGPAGTVHLSIEDWARFVWLWFSNRTPALLDRGRLNELATPGMGDYAAGWNVVQRHWAGGTALNHDGSNTYWYTILWIAPSQGRAYIAGANSADDDTFTMLDGIVGKLISHSP